MKSVPSWQYDEMKQIGKDYADPAEVEAYDSRHGKFRNVEKENTAILEALGLRPQDLLIDFGTGTGAFAVQAAGRCSKVYAVDISTVMLDYAAKKAARKGATNIVFRPGGFLTYDHAEQPADAIVTNTAMHHLPDFWKGMALQRLNGMLKPGGQLFLSDVIFEQEGVHGNIERLIRTLEAKGGEQLRRDMEAHLRSEYSTYDWIMDGLIERGGFEIVSKRMKDGVVGRYLCRKRGA